MNILVWPGSLREGSLNRRLAEVIAGKLSHQGIGADLINFRDFEMPLYDGDLESSTGIPNSVSALAEKISGCDGWILVTPEYNFGVPGPVKNAIDWLSRIRPYPTSNKTCFLASAAPGLVGGARGLIALRPTLSFMGSWLVPDSFSLAEAANSFGPEGQLKDEALDKMLSQMLDKFIHATKNLTSP
ncbi:MAG: NAD(P)H-dependent oxidoreductase [Rhodospirillaceae bacterium]